MKNNHDLPIGWVHTSVVEIAESIQYGHTASASDRADGPRFLRITDIQDNQVDWRTVPSCVISADDIEKYKLLSGDIVFARTGATTGKSFLIGNCPLAVFASYLIRLRMHSEVFSPYVQTYFLTNDYWRQIEGGKRGIGQPNVNAKVLGKITLPLAPINEQRRIVEKVDELFSDLDVGIAALKRAKANLKRYRAGVLKAAVDGSLTAEWRATTSITETGSQLLEKILAERRRRWEAEQLAKFEAAEKTPPKNWQEKYVEPEPPDTSELPDLPDGWCWAALESIADLVGGITKDQKRSREGTKEVPYLRVANVQRGYLDLKEMKTIHASPEDIADLRLLRGDILFTEGGDRDKLGRGWIWQEELPECIHQNHIFRARLIDSVVEPKFISHHGNTFGRDWFTTAGKQTTNLASINLGILRRFPVPLPPAEEQQQIIAEVDHQLSVVDAALAQVEQDLTRANQLRQSILRRAFEGKLVPQDPSDEPASVLLERIRQERAAKAEAEKGQKKGGKRKGAKNMTSEDRRLLLDVLKEHPKGLTPEALLREAGYAISEVDDFYSDLRCIAAQIEEERPNGTKINKWPKGAKILLRAKGE